MGVTFMKGGASEALAKKHETEVAAAKAQGYKLWRFRLKPKESAKITFIDGDLNANGNLTPPRYYEHSLYLNGNWNNHFLCPEKTDPSLKDKCPICETGDKPALVALFTVIDHRETKSNDGKKVYKDQKRLMVVKSNTFEMLNKLAGKRKGLTGARFEVTRNTDKEAAVGAMFDFEEKSDVEDLKKLYMVEKVDPATNTKTMVTNFEPADYEKEVGGKSGMELRKLGLGVPGQGPPTETTQTDGEQADFGKDL